MVNTMGIPVRTANPQQDTEEEDDYYGDDTLATPAPKPFAYSIPPPTSMASFPSPCKIFSYLSCLDAVADQVDPQAGPPTSAYPAYPSSNAPESSMSLCEHSRASESKSLTLEAPLSEQATTLTSNLRIMADATVAEDSVSPREAALHGSMNTQGMDWPVLSSLKWTQASRCIPRQPSNTAGYVHTRCGHIIQF
jgi:hypothetical protein